MKNNIISFRNEITKNQTPFCIIVARHKTLFQNRLIVLAPHHYSLYSREGLIIRLRYQKLLAAMSDYLEV